MHLLQERLSPKWNASKKGIALKYIFSIYTVTIGKVAKSETIVCVDKLGELFQMLRDRAQEANSVCVCVGGVIVFPCIVILLAC